MIKDKIDHLVLVATAILSIVVSLLDLLGLLESIHWLAGRTPALTLLVAGFIAGYLALERRGKLDKIEKTITEGINLAINSLRGVEVRSFSNIQEMYEYQVQRLWQAKKQIDDLTWGYYDPMRTLGQKRAFQKYQESLPTILSKKNIKYREVMTFPNRSRLERAESMLAKNLYGYELRYYDIPHDDMPPLMQFIVIDKEEVIFCAYRAPYLPTEGEIYLSVRHPNIVPLYLDYYDSIWQGAKKLKEADQIDRAELQRIQQELKSREQGLPN